MKHKLTIIKDAVPLNLLDLFKKWAIACEQWGLNYPINYPIEERFFKMNVINNDGMNIEKATGAGIAHSIISMIHQKCKLFGLLDTDWKEDWGGGFHWDGKDYYAPPGSFMLFNPRIPHKAGDIYCEKKRFAVDYTVASSTPYVLQSPYN